MWIKRWKNSFIIGTAGAIGHEKKHGVGAATELLLSRVFYPCTFSMRHVAVSWHIKTLERTWTLVLLAILKIQVIKQIQNYKTVKKLALTDWQSTLAYGEPGTCSIASIRVPYRLPVGSEFNKEVSSPQPPECWDYSFNGLYPYIQLRACFPSYKMNMLGYMSHSIFLTKS